MSISAFWRWQHKYMLPKRNTMAPFYQITVAGMALFYYINYERMRKYHQCWFIAQCTNLVLIFNNKISISFTEHHKAAKYH